MRRGEATTLLADKPPKGGVPTSDRRERADKRRPTGRSVLASAAYEPDNDDEGAKASCQWYDAFQDGFAAGLAEI